MIVKQIMTKDVIAVKEETTISEVIKILLENRISGVPVVNDQDEVVGIVSEADLIYRENNLYLPAFIPVLDGVIFLESMKKMEEQLRKMTGYKTRDVMTKQVVTIDEDISVEEAARIMMNKRINRLPVIKDKKIAGIVTRADILKAIAD